MRGRMILMIDNYDSFTYNLVQYLGELGADVEVRRNDAITLDEVAALAPDGDRDLARAVHAEARPASRVPLLSSASPARFPILGVCLGHQAIGAAFGGEIVRADAHHARQDVARSITTAAASSRARRTRSTRPATTRCVIEPRHAAGGARGDARGPARARSWACATASCPSRACSSIPESILTLEGKRLLANFLAPAAGADDDPRGRDRARLARTVSSARRGGDCRGRRRGHGRRGDAGADRRARWSRCACKGETGRRARRRGARDARAWSRGSAAPARRSSTPAAPAATARAPSTSRPRRRSSSRPPACRSPSTATARSRDASAAPTCSRRSACASISSRPAARRCCARPASPSCSRRASTPRCATPRARGASSACAPSSTCSGRSTNPAGARHQVLGVFERGGSSRWRAVLGRLGAERALGRARRRRPRRDRRAAATERRRASGRRRGARRFDVDPRRSA